MKQIFIKELKTDDSFMDFFIVKEISVKLGANQKQYLDMVLGDCTGQISGKKWDVSEDETAKLSEIKPGNLVKIKALVIDWKGVKQLRVTKIRKAVESDGLEISDFIEAAPEKADSMFEYIMDRASALEDPDLKALCVEVLEEYHEKLMYYPAAQKNHHAYMSGLLYHTKRMLMNGERMCQVYTNLNKDLLTAGVILHDMEKTNEIESDEYGNSQGYKMEGILLGHIIQGVRDLDARMRRLGFSDEKAIMVEHMILSHHYEPEFGSPKKPMFPEAEILHYLDMIDAKMFDMEYALKDVEPGTFSDKVWTLDNRKIYKPKGK